MKAKSDGSLGVALLFIGALVLYLYWDDLRRMTSDAQNEEAVMWLYASDIAPGDTIEGRVRVEDGMRLAIRGVVVTGAGDAQHLPGHEMTWGDEITAGILYDREQGNDELAFGIKVPRDAKPGADLELQIAIEYVTAERAFPGFTNEDHVATFHVEVPVHGRTASVLRRAGKAALAIGSWILVVMGYVAASRWYTRRRRTPRDAWMLLLVPYGLAGWWWFAMLLGHALRLHGWWFVLPCVVVWYLAFFVAVRIVNGDAIRRFVVRQTLVPTIADDAYRSSGAPVPSRTVDDVEAAWQVAGLAVVRRQGALEVFKLGVGSAFVALPESGMFGGGAEFLIRSEGHAIVDEIVTASEKVLGPLSWSE